MLSIGFNSCSEENEQIISGTFSGENLTAKNGGIEVKSAKLKIDNGKYTLSNIVNGDTAYTFSPDVEGIDNATHFKYSNEANGMKVEIEGYLYNNSTAKVDVNITILTTPLLKNWEFNEVTESGSFGPITKQDPIAINIETTTDSVLVTEYSLITGAESKKMKHVDELEETYSSLISLLVGQFSDLKLTFKENGYADLSITNGFSESTDEDKNVNMVNTIRYSYRPIIKLMLFDTSIEAIGLNLQIPFMIELTESKLNGTLPFQVLQPLLMSIPTGDALNSLLALLESSLPEDIKSIYPIIKGLIVTTAELLSSNELEDFAITAKLQVATPE